MLWRVSAARNDFFFDFYRDRGLFLRLKFRYFLFYRPIDSNKKYPRIPESDAGVSLSSMRSVCGLFSALRYENKIKVVCF